MFSYQEQQKTVIQKKTQQQYSSPQQQHQKMQHYTAMPAIVQKKQNNTGIPDNLKQSMENRSGFSMDDVRVHYHSHKPAHLQALAYTQGTNVYIASGQEKHLAHELTHVIQQKQGIVRPTATINGVAINADTTLEREADRQYIRTQSHSNSTAEVTQCLFSSQKLAHNIRAANSRIRYPNYGIQAHHIIPIKVVKEELAKEDIINLEEFDEAWNGIFLPDSKGYNLPRHLGSHENYTNTVRDYIHKNIIGSIVSNLGKAKRVANYFRGIIQDLHTQGVTNINEIEEYYINVGSQVIPEIASDLRKIQQLENENQTLEQELGELQQRLGKSQQRLKELEKGLKKLEFRNQYTNFDVRNYRLLNQQYKLENEEFYNLQDELERGKDQLYQQQYELKELNRLYQLHEAILKRTVNKREADFILQLLRKGYNDIQFINNTSLYFELGKEAKGFYG